MSVLLEQKGGKPQEESGEASGDELPGLASSFLQCLRPLFSAVLRVPVGWNAGGNKAGCAAGSPDA